MFSALLEADPSKEEMITEIAIQTNSFTNISKAVCEALIAKATELINEVKK